MTIGRGVAKAIATTADITPRPLEAAASVRRVVRAVLPVWMVWLVAVVLITAVTGAWRVVPVFHPKLPPVYHLPGLVGHGPLWPAHYWDAAWYAQIAAHGYPRHVAREYGFFPLWPLLVAAAGKGVGVVWSGVVLGVISSLVAFCLLSVTNPDRNVRRTAVTLACLPGSFSLAYGYPDALAATCACAACVLAASRRPAWAIPLAFATAALRTNGFLVSIPLAVIAWRQRGPARVAAAVAPLVGFLVVAGGFALWSHRLLVATHVQAKYWGRKGPLQAWTMLHRIFHQSPHWNLAAVPMCIVGVVLTVEAWRRGRAWFGWAAYATAVIGISLASGALGGISRHVIFAFPLVWVAAGSQIFARRWVAIAGALGNAALCFLVPSYFP